MRPSRVWCRLLLVSVAAIAVSFVACSHSVMKTADLPPAEHPPGAAHKQVKHGHELFHEYCATCHGVTGEGNGPLAGELRQAPADLTRIAQRRGGDFPEQEIHSIIDGQAVVRGHGPGNMPVWGREFSTLYSGGTGDENEVIRRMRVHEIVEYLRSIQVGG